MKLPDFSYVYVDAWAESLVRGRSVLHLGCVGDFLSLGPSACLHVRMAEVADLLYGVDLDSEGLGRLRSWVPEDPAGRVRYFCGDVEDLPTLGIGRSFDVVLAGAIIEHLSNPGRMLAGARALCRPDGRVIVSTPHAFGLLQFLRVALRRYEAVNRQHTCWFSAQTLAELCSRHGLVPVSWHTGYGYRRPGWAVTLKRAIGVPFFRLFPHLGGSLIGVFKPRNRG